MVVTLSDIADRVGVRKQTVSVVLNNKVTPIKVADDTRRRILEIARELGYRPNGAARALASGRTGRIALWVPGIEGLFFHEIRCLFHTMLGEKQFDVLMGQYDPDVVDTQDAGSFSQVDVDGILLYGSMAHPRLRELVERTFGFRVPVVSMVVDHVSDLSQLQDFVQVDTYFASRQAVEHLVASGCQRIAYMNIPNVQDSRWQGYVDVMRAAGRSVEWIISPDFMRSTARQTIKDYVASQGCPDGIFCVADEMAMGVCRGLYDLGIHVPKDVVLVGAEGIEDLDYLESPVHSVTVPKEEMCRSAWQFLHQRIANPNGPQQGCSLTASFRVRK